MICRFTTNKPFMRKIIQTIALAVLCLNISSFAQSSTSNITPLKIGDKIPNELWNLQLQVVNHPQGKETITLNEYKGKLIILDFWATWCGACIGNIPKLDTIKAFFPIQLEVLMVSQETDQTLDLFFGKRKQKINHLSISNDQLLRKFFPYLIIPHYVWIDKDGRYLGSTDVQALKKEYVAGLLSGYKSVKFAKNDIDTKVPIYSKDLPLEQTLHYSILVKGWNPGLPSGVRSRYVNDLVVGSLITNSSIEDLFKRIAYGLFRAQGERIYRSSIIMATEDKNKLNDEHYSYEFIEGQIGRAHV